MCRTLIVYSRVFALPLLFRVGMLQAYSAYVIQMDLFIRSLFSVHFSQVSLSHSQDGFLLTPKVAAFFFPKCIVVNVSASLDRRLSTLCIALIFIVCMFLFTLCYCLQIPLTHGPSALASRFPAFRLSHLCPLFA
ncbi:hypothetical protein C8Q75DRAFT_404885 [Abortiporus biennis]|nr:hypothetical protein C8Q75DRAFT_404885 [Abortiporus biennis]